MKYLKKESEPVEIISLHGCEQSKVNRILVLARSYVYDNKYCKPFMIYDLNFRGLCSCSVINITPIGTAFKNYLFNILNYVTYCMGTNLFLVGFKPSFYILLFPIS